MSWVGMVFVVVPVAAGLLVSWVVVVVYGVSCVWVIVSVTFVIPIRFVSARVFSGSSASVVSSQKISSELAFSSASISLVLSICGVVVGVSGEGCVGEWDLGVVGCPLVVLGVCVILVFLCFK